MKPSDVGRIEAIWVKRAMRGPMDAVDGARLIAGQGIEGNANQGGWRQVTIISKEAWEAAEASLGVAVEPSNRRANVMVSGIDLRESRDQVMALGPCTVHIRGETRPCTRMDDAHAGLRDALEPDWRGGAFGVVVTGGQLSVGDPEMVLFRVELTSEAAPLAHRADSPARKDIDMHVSLSVENDVIEILDDQPQQVPPPASGSPRSGFFRIRAKRAGICRLAVRFSQGGADLAVIPMAVEVVDGSARSRPVRGEASAAPRDSTLDEKLVVSVELREEHGQVYYKYWLYSEPLNFHNKEFRSAPLKDRGDSPAGTRPQAI